MLVSDIVIKGAREHNLRNVDVVLPRNKLICLTGVSGSGKSSLAFDTLYAEGQRRYVESLSSFARQFLGQMPKPDVDFIGGLSPSISISQKSSGTNPRSTVGTITEIYDFLRVLFARVGQGFCPECGNAISAQSREQIIARIMEFEEGTRFVVLAPIIRAQKGEYKDLFEDLLKQGFVRARVNGEIFSLASVPSLDRRLRHNIEVVIDRLVRTDDIRNRLGEAIELALKLGDGNLVVAPHRDEAEPAKGKKRGKTKSNDIIFSQRYACNECGISFEPPSPQLFSFNSPQGMCPDCDGLGQLFSFDPELLVPDDSLTFKKGAIELVGTWKGMGRWRRHIFNGVATTMERILDLPDGTMLETPWRELSSDIQYYWLWGTGEQHITYTWRAGAKPVKYGGTFDGVIPDLIARHRKSKSKAKTRQFEKYMSTIGCPTCEGERLVSQARHIKIETRSKRFLGSHDSFASLPDVCKLTIEEASDFFKELQLTNVQWKIAEEAIKEIRSRLGFLLNVGLDYLALDRTAPTLSGGESQRIRLAAQIGSGLVGVLYILDEPSIGLHPRDNDRLLATLQRLRDIGNTVVVVEHDEDTMRVADHVIDFGPGPGVRGGEVVVEGSVSSVLNEPRSVTGQYLSGQQTIETPEERRPISDEKLVIRGAEHNNLKQVDVAIPTGAFVCITGVSGSGKSSLVNDILVEALRRDLNNGIGEPGKHAQIEGLELLDKMIAIDQSPIGRTPRSNPGTYIKVFDDIRTLFSQLPEARQRGYAPGRFSFNVKEGRCEACEGNGSNKLEMDFLADVWVECPVCEGHRFNRETLQVRFKGHSISDVLEMDIQQALELFENIPKVHHKLQTLHNVGLDYLKIGQPSPTLSGGEAQRIKLARELVKKSTGQTLYLLDEPTTGLHFADIQLLLNVLHDFVDAGNTVVVVEHNLDVIKTADWVVDLGPEGGEGGGRIVAEGTPEEIATARNSHTGRSLARHMQPQHKVTLKSKPKKASKGKLAKHIRIDGAQQHNLKSISTKIARDKMTVLCGPSGSGKTSLAMDTIYAEGQRRYVESLSSYARQFISQMPKPKFEKIEGLSPAIAIEQKNLGHTPRSTVGTVTEIYDYFRILFARLGEPYCPDCQQPIGTQSADEIIDRLLEGSDEGTRVYILAPLDTENLQDYESLWAEVREGGYIRVRVDGVVHAIDEVPELDRRSRHDVQVVVDRAILKKSSRSRIGDSVEKALALGKGTIQVVYPQEEVPEKFWRADIHSQHLACHQCGRGFEPLSPHHFSFNSSIGWCNSCEGLGVQEGANPAVLFKDEKLTLAAGAMLLWPDLSSEMAEVMLNSLSRSLGIPTDVPYSEMSTHHRRLLLYGTGDQWIEAKAKGKRKPLFRFQFKGFYPALRQASNIVPNLRTKLSHLIDDVDCSECGGSRLRDDASAVRFQESTISDLCRMPFGKLQELVQNWDLSNRDREIAGEVLREIQGRLQFLNDVGLHYLDLARGAATLSNGEAQRIRLASQLGSGLSGVLYVLDEPTIGLHPRDNTRLLNALHRLRDLGNTLLVVEHDREVIEGSDFLCDFGPGAGKLGGQVVAEGSTRQVVRRKASVTGPYLTGKKSIPVPQNRRVISPPGEADTKTDAINNDEPSTEEKPTDWLQVKGARHHNLRNLDVDFPLGTLTAVTGPSGSGKSSLIHDVLWRTLARRLHRAQHVPGAHDDLLGIENINKVIQVDQQPLGNSPSSNPATYTGVFELIRMLFAQLPDAKLRGYSARRFSFNVAGGRCEDCEGNGQTCVEMHFLPDVWVTCETCNGQRYNTETLSVRYKGHSISDVLSMTCGEAVELFSEIPKIRRILQTLCDVGLDYLTLGQAAPTLSGGEAQRVKLAAELSRPDTGRTLYLLDEPTTGLHFDDLAKLLSVLQRLVDVGNTVVVIEHNLDIIKAADWIIDMGPEAGHEGGDVVAAGSPEQLVELTRQEPGRSHTADSLAEAMADAKYEVRQKYEMEVETERAEGELDITEVGREAKMPWEVDGRKWHTESRVDRKGGPVKWEGQSLAHVVDRIHELGEFSDTDWNARSVVEISAEKKSDGWFFHAITAETWLLKMKFRVPRDTFDFSLVQDMDLPTLNQMDELPIYSNSPRVLIKKLAGKTDEVEMRIYKFAEIDTPVFDHFLEKAVAGFQRNVDDRKTVSARDLTPWKVLGEKWHFMRKGFPRGAKVAWEVTVLEQICKVLKQVVPQGEYNWQNKQIVHLHLPGQSGPWLTMATKRAEGLNLYLTGPKQKVPYGRFAHLASNTRLDTSRKNADIAFLEFKTLSGDDVDSLRTFLEEHRDVCTATEPQS